MDVEASDCLSVPPTRADFLANLHRAGGFVSLKTSKIGEAIAHRHREEKLRLGRLSGADSNLQRSVCQL